MSDDQARADIALIRTALEQGRAYAFARSPDMIIWGCLVAAGYLGTWAFATGHLAMRPGPLWLGVLAAGWLFYLVRRLLRRLPRRVPLGGPAARLGPLVTALCMLWLGVGISLTLTGVVGILRGGMGAGWFNPIAAGVMGAGFFASAPLCNLPWLRWVAVAWWLGELALFWLHGTILVLPFAAALYLLLLAGPGLALRVRQHAA